MDGVVTPAHQCSRARMATVVMIILKSLTVLVLTSIIMATVVIISMHDNNGYGRDSKPEITHCPRSDLNNNG